MYLYGDEEYKRALKLLILALAILGLAGYFIVKFTVMIVFMRGGIPWAAVAVMCAIYISTSPFIAYYVAEYCNISEDRELVRKLQRAAVIIAVVKSIIISLAVLAM